MEDNKAIITQEILKNKTGEFWKALPQYADTEEPKWSNGWLERFKKRFKIKQYTQHGEASSAAIDDPNNIRQMEALRNLCDTYDLNDILNMDETALYWKMTPSRTLATKAQSGGKKNKD